MKSEEFAAALSRGLSLLLILLVASCSGDNASDIYPSIVTEFAMIQTDASGAMTQLTTDDGRSFVITNPQSGFAPNARFRVVCGYVVDGQSVTLHHATGAYLLRDSTAVTHEPDPVKVTSVWQSGRFVNMQLAPLTQGGIQYWGFRTEGVSSRTHHIRLHHRQNADPLSYTQTIYASISVDSLKSVTSGDSIALHVSTFQGEQVWTFKKP